MTLDNITAARVKYRNHRVIFFEMAEWENVDNDPYFTHETLYD